MILTWDAADISGNREAVQKEIENLDFQEFQFLTNDPQTPPLYLTLQAP